jgi:hypothetical protein
VSLKDNQGRTVKSYRIGDATGKAVFEFNTNSEVDRMCDQLLQQFHRFDEELSVQGKWQGGSVTGVCKGWGTDKVGLGISFYQHILMQSLNGMPHKLYLLSSFYHSTLCMTFTTPN